jgi:hypothetical protein
MAVSSRFRELTDYIVKNIPNEIDRGSMATWIRKSLKQEVMMGEYSRHGYPMQASGQLYKSIGVGFRNDKRVSRKGMLSFEIRMLKYGFAQSDGYKFSLSYKNEDGVAKIANWLWDKGLLKGTYSPETQAKQFIFWNFNTYKKGTNWIENTVGDGIDRGFDINISDKFRQEFSDRLIKIILDGGK